MTAIADSSSIFTIFEKNSNRTGANPRRHHQRQDSCLMASDVGAARTDPLGYGLCKPYKPRKLANSAPLGFCAFALSSFVLSAVNTHARGINDPNIVVPLALGYGGLVQLLAGMWEIARGDTFGATAFSSFGGFWISYAIMLAPSWGVTAPNGAHVGDSASPLAFFLTGWFIFTTILLLCTLRSAVMLFLLFFALDLTFLFLACEQYATDMENVGAAAVLRKAGGVCGFLSSFLAWYNALAGIQDKRNSFFQVPVFKFPWSENAHEHRKKSHDDSA